MRKLATCAINYGVACAIILGGVSCGVATAKWPFYHLIVIVMKPFIAQHLNTDKRHSQLCVWRKRIGILVVKEVFRVVARFRRNSVKIISKMADTGRLWRFNVCFMYEQVYQQTAVVNVDIILVQEI